MEYLDICTEEGLPTGEIVSREKAHQDGILHRTAHVWILRNTPSGAQILLQKRSMNKDSFPGLYDTSSAGHIDAGEDVLPSALRELKEELGLTATPEQLHPIGTFRIQYEKVFHGKPFHDNEVAFLYIYDDPVDETTLTLQDEEVEEVRWFLLEDVWQEILDAPRERFCAPKESLELLRQYLKEHSL